MCMGKILISDLYSAFHSILREDPVILERLGMTANASMEELATRIQKRKKPQKWVQHNLPLISFYKNPGQRGKNYLEYRFTITLDIYTQDNVELAISLADRIVQLFDGKWISGLSEGSVFKGEYITSAEADCELEETFKYYIQIGFTVGIDEN